MKEWDKSGQFSLNCLDQLLKDAARLRAIQTCKEGWATLSEEELAGVIYTFAMEINEHLLRANEYYAKLLVEGYTYTAPFYGKGLAEIINTENEQ